MTDALIIAVLFFCIEATANCFRFHAIANVNCSFAIDIAAFSLHRQTLVASVEGMATMPESCLRGDVAIVMLEESCYR